ncbi:F-box protein At4g00755 [Sesamum indicum]|uniref:F-box protein At4g00755 n=1 Tax=Sesamum indicum TaxID=4182 RepID=A0A6I9U2C9_SESIN|nr:F-box protein At4g00755 [Sesamum indicum]XP_011091640.1 F-box protein At4g00755 [Sesamum indicum]
MATGRNFMDYFEIDVISNVLGFLNNPADLIRASAVSRSWRHHVVANGLCKKLWLRKFPQVTNVAYAVEDSDGITKLSNISSGSPANWEALKRDHKIYSFLLQPLAKPIISPKDCLGFPIGASSTDHDLAENVINTLTPIDRYPGGASYWSSKGEKDPNVPENILYRLNTSISIVTEVHIRPFQAFWEPGRPVYSPKSVRFRLGRPKSMVDVEIDVCPVQQPSVDKYIWTYTSPVFPMAQESCLQQFKLPEPVVCVGGIFQIELFGRARRGPIDGLFYICLGYIRVLGHSLEPAFNLEMYPSGELQLKYYPHALEVLHRSFSGERSSSVDEAESERLLHRAELLLEEMAEEVLDEWD